jgi:hypothetical protein
MRWENFRGVIVFLALMAVACVPLVSSARPLTTSITIVNNSNRTIRNVYLSHVGADDWGDNQLGNGTISAGGSFTISNLNWDQAQVKVIAEDQDGCFLSSVVNATANSTWTITNNTSADCGGSSGGAR